MTRRVKNEAAASLARLRARKLTKARRQEIAQIAARARWGAPRTGKAG